MATSSSQAIAYQRTSVPNGRLGMWWFLGSEIAIFGGLIASYVVLRLRHGEWELQADHTMGLVGLINTIVLLTGSLFAVKAHIESHRGDGPAAARHLVWTMGTGVLFLALKGYEYGHEIGAGFTPGASLFWAYYFLMTGLHGLHVLVGVILMAVVWAGARQGQRLHRVELGGIYWHFVDVVWLFLFPLLYIAS